MGSDFMLVQNLNRLIGCWLGTMGMQKADVPACALDADWHGDRRRRRGRGWERRMARGRGEAGALELGIEDMALFHHFGSIIHELCLFVNEMLRWGVAAVGWWRSWLWFVSSALQNSE